MPLRIYAEFTRKEMDALEEAVSMGTGPLGESMGVNTYVLIKFLTRVLKGIPKSDRVTITGEPIDGKEPVGYIYVDEENPINWESGT